MIRFIMNSDYFDRFSAALEPLTFSDPTAWIYDPWRYAAEGMMAYCRLLSPCPRVFFLGMNPGPWGMAQTGVPFGAVEMVRDWFGLDPVIGKPVPEHAKRPVLGMACTRREVSGRRLWGLMKNRFGSPEVFFRDQTVWPYCHWMWLKESGANLPPNALRAAERKPLEAVCDRFLDELLTAWSPRHLVAIGQYAETALQRVRPGHSIVRIPHPSPASPAANRDWAGSVTRILVESGIWEDPAP